MGGGLPTGGVASGSELYIVAGSRFPGARKLGFVGGGTPPGRRPKISLGFKFPGGLGIVPSLGKPA